MPAPAAAVVAGTRNPMSEMQIGWLLRTIEGDVIPRLLQAHQSPQVAFGGADVAPVRPQEAAAAELAQIVLAQPAEAAGRYVEALRAQGAMLESIYLGVLAPAARRLGDLWMADLCDFTQVTIGLWRLQQLMHELSPAFHDDDETEATPRRAMLVPVPGSQHTFGLLMVAEFFRRAGWVVWGDPASSTEDLVRAAKTNWFDLVGFSVGSNDQLSVLHRAIGGIRAASLNAGVAVMVGGPVFVDQPESVAEVGADGTAADAAQAVALADALYARSTAQRQAPGR